MLLTCLSALGVITAVHAQDTSPSLQGASAQSSASEIDRWEGAVQQRLAGVSPTPGAILCVGSSQMSEWKTVSSDLAPLTVYNLGIGGSTMKVAADLFVKRLVIPFKPRAVILYEGSNDIAKGVTPDEFIECFKDVHRQIHTGLPDARLYVLAIVPSPGRRFKKWETIQQANKMLKAECAKEPWMKFLDTTSPLIGADGQPRPECFIPGDIHLSAEGYKVWTSVIGPAVIDAEKGFEPPTIK